ncbi:hypothetical protein QEN19_004408 [Hanseniaspora menglaensis]
MNPSAPSKPWIQQSSAMHQPPPSGLTSSTSADSQMQFNNTFFLNRPSSGVSYSDPNNPPNLQQQQLLPYQQQMSYMHPQVVQMLLQQQSQQQMLNNSQYPMQMPQFNHPHMLSTPAYNGVYMPPVNIPNLTYGGINVSQSYENTAVPEVYTTPVPNINATNTSKSTSDKKDVEKKYKKPNRIFIACTRCHKSKIRCLQLNEEEIGFLPQEHIKHMVQLIGNPTKNNVSLNIKKPGRSEKSGINYPCKRCYNANKICVYDHSRIGRGRKSRAAKNELSDFPEPDKNNEIVTAKNIKHSNDPVNIPKLSSPVSANTHPMQFAPVNLAFNSQQFPLFPSQYSAVNPVSSDGSRNGPGTILPAGMNHIKLPPLKNSSSKKNKLAYSQSFILNQSHTLEPNFSSTGVKNIGTLPEVKNNDKTINPMEHLNLLKQSVDCETKNSLSEFKVKEYITVTNIVKDGFTQQLQRSNYPPSLSEMINNLDKVTDEEMDMKNYDIIKMGILNENECARRFNIFKTKMLNLPQIRSICSVILDMEWEEVRQKHPKLFLTLISGSSLVDSVSSECDIDLVACYKLSEATLKMIFFYGKKKKLRTLEMYLCINVLVLWDNQYQGIKWNDYENLISIFKDYKNALCENGVDISVFINNDFDIGLDTVISKKTFLNNCTSQQPAFNSMLLTDEKKLVLPCTAVILELSTFSLNLSLYTGCGGDFVNEVGAPLVENSILLNYGEGLKNSTSIYHQNLHIMTTLSHFFMDILEANNVFKSKTFEELTDSKYFEVLISQTSTFNTFVQNISVDNKSLRLYLHSMKAQLLDILIESFLISYSKVKGDSKKCKNLFDSIDFTVIAKIHDFLNYSFDCINELDTIADEFLIILPSCYLARISLCFEMILKLLHFTLTNTKKFETINQRILEFSLKNITITHRCARLLQTYPCNTVVRKLQTMCTHAYFAEITYWKKAIAEDHYIIDSKDHRLLAALKNFEIGYKSCEHTSSIIFKYTDSFFSTLEWEE